MDARLYLCCDARDPDTLEPLLTGAAEGGVDVIQLREKGLDRETLEAAAGVFRRVADRTGSLFVVNDDPHLAVEVGADGVHVGQDDVSAADARELVGEDRIVGLSTHRPEQLDEALGDPSIDYFSVGPVWETPTKQGRPAAGLDYVSYAVASGTERPWFAIGGIDEGNLAEVTGRGATRICVVRAIADSPNPSEAARRLRMGLGA